MSSHPDDPAVVRAAGAARRLARKLASPGPGPRSADDRADHRAHDRADDPGPDPARPPRPNGSATKGRAGSDLRRAARQQEERADRVVRAQWRLLQAAIGGRTAPEAPTGADPDPGLVDRAVSQARRARAMSQFADRLARGHDVRRAHAHTVRELCEVGLRPAATGFILGTEPLTRDRGLSALGRGLVLHSMAEFELAWRELGGLSPAELAELAPVEAVTAALAAQTPESVALAREVAGHGAHLASADLVELAGRFLVTGHVDLARDLADQAESRTDLDATLSEALASLRRWTHPGQSGQPALPSGRVSLAVMDYHQPDHHRASRNVGDYVQTLAMLGNLVRFSGARFHGEDGVADLLRELQQRVRPELRLADIDTDVHLTPVSRDFSAGDAVPENTWMIGFGWHLHSTFRLGFGLPYHPHIHPVFVSFHLNRVRALTPETVDYLRRHGPVGCRDWTTVYILLGAGVDAFFTGCLTTTVDAVFPSPDEAVVDDDRVVGAVDLKPMALHKIKRTKEVLTHAGAEFREASFVAGTRAASDLLARYQRRFDRVVTSRLHSYLPATSLGLPVKFRPPIAGDVRFDGLLDLAPQSAEFRVIRDGIRDLLADVHGWVLAGMAADEVYLRWRERTAPMVAEARERWDAPPAPLSAEETVEVSPTTYAAGPAVDGSAVTDVSTSVDADLVQHLPALVEAILTTATTPLRLWVTTRGVGEQARAAFAAAYPDLAVTFLDCDGIDQDPELDRFLLPGQAGLGERLVHVDVDTVVDGDLAELAATDLGGHALAVRPGRRHAADLWREAGDRLAPEVAFELRRTLSARHRFDLAVPAVGVLVLDTARLRADGLVDTSLPLARRYGLGAAGALLLHAGADRAELSPRWSTMPPVDPVDPGSPPALWTYAGAGRPWDDEPVPGADRWREHARRAADRLRQASVGPLASSTPHQEDPR